MEVKQHGDNKNGSFYIEENGQKVGVMTYHFPHENKMVIVHTEVNPSQEGKGLGKLLVKAAVDYARAHNIKIDPVCPYAKSVFNRKPEYADVLA
ncbi:MAG: GCN5-related N-acetyltransferase [Bacteroidota bacterium]|nr:GCN5-related N-acetyltransferase [Bacteroidota bacterium]